MDEESHWEQTGWPQSADSPPPAETWGQFAALPPSPPPTSPEPPTPQKAGSPEILKSKRANFATCERCAEELCKVYLKLAPGPWHEGEGGGPPNVHGVDVVRRGCELCYRCAAVFLLDVNYRFETTGGMGDCAILSDDHRDKRARSSHDEPERHRAQLSRSRSFMQDEHLCELCSNQLVSFQVTRMVPSPSSELPDEEQSLELCPPCTAGQLVACHGKQTDLANFCEILHRRASE